MLRVLCAMISALPRGAALAFGRALGRIAFVLRVRRRVAVENIVRGLRVDRAEAGRLARRAYENLGCVVVEFLRIGNLDAVRARALLGLDNLARIRRLLERQKGLLVLGAHLGNWDLLACAAAASGLKVNVVTRELKNPRINAHWMAQRAKLGVRLLPARGSALAIRAALRRNEIVALVLDQHEPGGEAVSFLGRPAATTRSLARLAGATGAPVVGAFLLRQGAGFQLSLTDPLPWLEAEDQDLRIFSNTQQYTGIIEERVRAYPEQWFWLHRRWKIDGRGLSCDRSGRGAPPPPVALDGAELSRPKFPI